MRPIQAAPSGSSQPGQICPTGQISSPQGIKFCWTEDGPKGIDSSPLVLSIRPPQKPITGPPIASIAVSPAKTIRSPQLNFSPNWSLMGWSNCNATSRLPLSGQLFSGSNRMLPPSQPPRPSDVRYDPLQCQANRMNKPP